MRRTLPDGIMWFDDLASVRAFMGPDYTAAHVPEAARAVLASFDRVAAHSLCRLAVRSPVCSSRPAPRRHRNY